MTFKTLQRPMMISKIHRATVTQADLHYVGSITIDATLMEAADLMPGQQVDVVDVTNGARLTTYAIPGEPDSGQICINGAAAHLIDPDDLVIIISYGMIGDEEAHHYQPAVVFVDAQNRVVQQCDEPGDVPDGSGLERSGLPLRDFRATGWQAFKDSPTTSAP
ncbi:aspartate 1-decarboxylase [Demequina aurantiaca]|uniref:aspartate 1-decarboxylase n=1 Tax=Demequina aurantiaca TaxID=676200 RepID=UPI003D34EFFF